MVIYPLLEGVSTDHNDMGPVTVLGHLSLGEWNHYPFVSGRPMLGVSVAMVREEKAISVGFM